MSEKISEIDYSHFTKVELQNLLKSKGHKISGNKDVLIARLQGKESPKRKITNSIKKEVSGRQNYKCANNPNVVLKGLENYQCPFWKYNQGSFDQTGFEIDHIEEFSVGYNNNIDNLQALCISCHKIKTIQFNRKPKINPVSDEQVTDSIYPFSDGSRIRLQSVTTGKNLRCTLDRNIEGNGSNGNENVWIVENLGNNNINLKNMSNNSYIRINGEKDILDCKGIGGKWCVWNPIQISQNIYVFESKEKRGHHIGILPDGSPKLPSKTATGKNGQFIVENEK